MGFTSKFSQMARRYFGGLAIFLGFFLVLSLVFSLTSFGSGSETSAKIEQSLIDLMNEDPNAQVEMILVLERDNEFLLSELREATREIDAELASISDYSKNRFSLVKDELGYEENKDFFLGKFRSGDEVFLQELELLEEKHGLSDAAMGDLKVRAENLRSERNKVIYSLLVEEYSSLQDAVIEELDALRGAEVISQDFSSNTITLSIPVSALLEVSAISGIHEIVSNEWELIDESDVSIPTIGVDVWHANGYGGGLIDLLSLNSGGIYASHPSLDHINWISACYVNPPCDAENPSGAHDTVVAGIVASDHSSFTGVSYGMDKFYNGRINTFSQAQSAINWAIINVPDTANHLTMSLAFAGVSPPYCGDSFQEEYVDEIVDLYDSNWVDSAGNNGEQSNENVSLPAGAYNILAVGASNDQNTVSRGDDIIGSTSSRGPVGICGSSETRIKPDITAPGMGITSTSQTGSFATLSGTSFSAPHVAASLVLLEDRFGSAFSTLEERALLFNSAEDRNYVSGAAGDDGPDNNWGYGYLDMARAYFEFDSVEKVNFAGANDTKYYLTSSTSNQDRVTSVWNRHIVSNEGVLNNFDIWLYDGSEGSLIDESTYIGRNIEQVSFGGVYDSAVLKARLSGLNTGFGEDVGLAFSNSYIEVGPPEFLANISSEVNLMCGETFTVSTSLINLGDLAAHDVLAELSIPGGVELEGNSTQDLGSVLAGAHLDIAWNLTATGAGTKTLFATIDSDSYGETISGFDDFVFTITGQPEICFDGLDNDCDGVIDNGCWSATSASLQQNISGCSTGGPCP